MLAVVPLMTARICGSRTSLRVNDATVVQLVRSHWRRTLSVAPMLNVSELPFETTALRSALVYQPGITAACPGVAKARKRAIAAAGTAANRKDFDISRTSWADVSRARALPTIPLRLLEARSIAAAEPANQY